MTSSECALLYSVDQAFLPLACISIASIVDYRSSPLPPVSILLHEVDQESRRRAERFLETLDLDFEFIEVDTEWCRPWAMRRRQSPAKFGILRMDQFLRPCVRRVLVIDADTRFVDDIAPLLDISLGSTVLAATDDIAMIADGRVPLLASKLGLPEGTGYFNSGLLVVDLERWKAEQIGSKAAAVFDDRPEILTFNDQCALNAVLQGRYTKLGFRWNHLVGSSPPDWPVSMFHYAGNLKPWHLKYVWKVWLLDHLIPPEHIAYYDVMSHRLGWQIGRVGWSGPRLAIYMQVHFFKLAISGRLRKYPRRQTSTHIRKVGIEHPELLV